MLSVMSEKVKQNAADAIKRMAEVKHLPIEDTIWLIDEVMDFQGKLLHLFSHHNN